MLAINSLMRTPEFGMASPTRAFKFTRVTGVRASFVVRRSWAEKIPSLPIGSSSMVKVSLVRGAIEAGAPDIEKFAWLLPRISMLEMVRVCPPPRFSRVRGADCTPDPAGKEPRLKNPGAEIRGS